MNRLKPLRKELGLSARALSEYTGIIYSTIVFLENEQRPFRQVHMDKLTAFFNVTNDYLLGRSDLGLIVRPEYGEEELLLTEKEYDRLKDNISLTILNNNDSISITVTSTKEEKVITQPKAFVYRELKGETKDYDMKETLSVKLAELSKKMTEEDLRKTIKFIEDYIIK